MSAFQMICPHCGIPISFAEEYKYTTLKCPICNESFREEAIVPKMITENTNLENSNFCNGLGVFSGVFCMAGSLRFFALSSKFDTEITQINRAKSASLRLWEEYNTSDKKQREQYVEHEATTNLMYGITLLGIGIALFAFFASRFSKSTRHNNSSTKGQIK